MRTRLSYANVAATLALFFAMSGGALAAKHYLINSTEQINPKVLNALKGKPGPAGPAGPQGAQGPLGPQGAQGGQGTQGPAGSALGFATIDAPSTLDAAHSSSNIAQGNITFLASEHIFCFKGLPFTPKMAIGNIDLNYGVGYTLQTNAGSVGGAAACPAGTQAAAVEADSTGAFKAPVTFYIAFY